MTHGVVVFLSVLGVVGQVLVGALIAVGLLALAGLRTPLRLLQRAVWGYELWLGFVVAAIATGGSLFFSEIAGYFPCELCWYQRIGAYPLSIILLLAALRNDHRVARYLLPLPVAGAGVAVYHLLIQEGVAGQSKTCFLSAPGGCGTKWINEFGYMTIPVLALTGFLLMLGLLLLAMSEHGGQEGADEPRAASEQVA
jgi:disulfide bond formation protein DsbB